MYGSVRGVPGNRHSYRDPDPNPNIKLGLTPSNSYNFLTLRFARNFWQKWPKWSSQRVLKQLIELS
jgi:hypothetical protein